jgi:drug/metabolite transporter (DMT)-like permease
MPNNPFISSVAARAAADAVCALCNGGTIRIFTGTQPSNADQVATGTLLATLAFSATAFAASTGTGVATANAITSANAVATGTAAWFRASESNGTTAVFDGSVGTSGCDLNLSSVARATGGNVAVSSMTYTQTN